MEKELIFALISTGIFLVWSIPYLLDVIKKRTIPHPFSYGMWAILVWINTYLLFLEKEWYSFVPWFFNWLSCVILFFFWVIYFRKIRVNWFDWLCLILIILLVLFYSFTKNIYLTVWLTLIVDGIAFLPTFKKGWLQPWTETIIFYFAAGTTQIFALLSFSWWQSVEATAFWLYLLVANFLFFLMVFFRRYYLKWWNSIFE